MREGPILLVEDNPDDVELTLRAFRRHRLENEVVVASDGVEAEVLLFGERQLAPAMILLDLKLPKRGGLEVLKSIREDRRTRLFPVVVLTSSVEEEDLVSAYELGANSYIRKPVDFNKFVEVMQQLGMYWLLLNEPAPGT
jgi:two-component system, response regulator